MTAEERDGLLAWCIDEALKKTGELSATAWDAAYLEMQRDRLRRLLGPVAGAGDGARAAV